MTATTTSSVQRGASCACCCCSSRTTRCCPLVRAARARLQCSHAGDLTHCVCVCACVWVDKVKKTLGEAWTTRQKRPKVIEEAKRLLKELFAYELVAESQSALCVCARVLERPAGASLMR